MKRARDEFDLKEANKRPRVYSDIEQGKWDQCSIELEQWFEQQEREEAERNQVLLKSDAALVVINLVDQGRAEIQGRINKLRDSFNRCGLIPSQSQCELFDLMIATSMRWVVGEKFEIYKPLILEELQLDKLFLDVHVIQPRQYGKTTGVAMGSKSVVKYIPIKVAIFATGGRTAKYMMKLIRQFVDMDPELQGRVEECNTETLRIKCLPFDGEDEATKGYSEIRAFPANGTNQNLVKKKMSSEFTSQYNGACSQATAKVAVFGRVEMGDFDKSIASIASARYGALNFNRLAQNGTFKNTKPMVPRGGEFVTTRDVGYLLQQGKMDEQLQVIDSSDQKSPITMTLKQFRSNTVIPDIESVKLDNVLPWWKDPGVVAFGAAYGKEKIISDSEAAEQLARDELPSVPTGYVTRNGDSLDKLVLAVQEIRKFAAEDIKSNDLRLAVFFSPRSALAVIPERDEQKMVDYLSAQDIAKWEKLREMGISLEQQLQGQLDSEEQQTLRANKAQELQQLQSA